MSKQIESPSNISDLIKKALKDAHRERSQVNVLIAGRTGVGKSTLINSIFGGKLAETGQGRPVTPTTREIKKKGFPLTIWDTRGLEMEAYDDTMRELENHITTRSHETEPSRHIHVAWLCIHEDGRRIEDAEIKLHEMLARHMPVIGVITKSRADQGFSSEVQKCLPLAKNVTRVRAIAEELDDGYVLPPMGLEGLAGLTMEVIPESFQRAFAAAQEATVQIKKEVSHKIVATATAAAVAAGASPIPFSDAVILVPIQIGMLARISSVFQLDTSKSFLSTILATAAGATGATLAGRAIVSNLLKFVPGAGTLAGGILSAGTAGALTTTLGEIYISALAAATAAAKGEPPHPNEVVLEFKKRLSGKTG